LSQSMGNADLPRSFPALAWWLWSGTIGPSRVMPCALRARSVWAGGREAGGVHHVPGRGQAAGGEVVVDLLGHLPVLHGGDGGGPVHHQMRCVLVARLGEVGPVAAPGVSRLTQ
jgi:hypothetical protein